MLSHRALMSQYYSCIFEAEYRSADISLHTLPLFHCAQLHCFLAPLLYAGATNIILHRADPAEMIRCIDKHRVAHMFAPQTVWIGILNNPELARHDLSSLAKATYNVSIMPVEINSYSRERFAGFKCPKKVHIFERLQKNPSGKIQKREPKKVFA